MAKILEFIAERDFSSGGQEGISFELATLVFGDDRCLVFQDRIDEAGEQRWHVLGNASLAPGLDATLLVVHSYREIFDGEGNYPHHLGPPS